MMIPWSLNSDKLQQLFLFIIKALLNITIIAVLTKSHKFTHPERRRGRRKLLSPTTPNTNNRINPTEIRNPQNSNNKNSNKITSTANHNTKSTNQTTTKKTMTRERERERICVLHVAHIYHTMWQQELPFFDIKLISSLHQDLPLSHCNGFALLWPSGKMSFKTLFEPLFFSKTFLLVRLGHMPRFYKISLLCGYH